MKCPFCTAENPSHANFCLNCGSPLDLKACKQCASINRKNAVACQMCGVPFDEPAVEQPAAESLTPAVPAAPSASHVEEAEALAKETLTFRKLFAEIEQDVNQQLAPVLPKPGVEPAAFAEPDPPPVVAPEEVLVVEPPPYLQEMLAQRAATPERGSRGWWVFAVVLLLAFGGFGYYAIIGRDAALATWKSLTSMRANTGSRPAGQIAPSGDTSASPGSSTQSPHQAAPDGKR